MKTKLINQQGKIKIPYQVSIESQGNYIALHLSLLIPGTDNFLYADTVGMIGRGKSAPNILEVYLKAEEKWGLNLVKMELETAI